MAALFLLLLFGCTNCMIIQHHAVNWSNAERYCSQGCNSNLASFHSDLEMRTTINIVENDYRFDDLLDADLWIGLVKDGYYWTDGSLFNYGNDTTGGVYPWANATEVYPNANINNCVQMDEDVFNWMWTNIGCDQPQRSLCLECNSQIRKYIGIRSQLNFDNAEQYCMAAVGTHLASVHNDRDMIDIGLICSMIGDNDDCWIGLNDIESEMNFVWTDQSPFDFGTGLNGNPWAAVPDNYNGNQHCVQLQYSRSQLWDDATCIDSNPFICNLPSELCNNYTIWDKNVVWIQSGCDTVDIPDTSFSIITSKQWNNHAETLLVEYIFKINNIVGVNSNNGSAGIVIHNFQSFICDYYYIGIQYASFTDLAVFIAKSTNNNLEILATNSSINYSLNTYITLIIAINTGSMFNINVNVGDTVLNYNDNYNVSPSIQHTVNSGYIGIRNFRTSITAKSLFVSGTPTLMPADPFPLDPSDCPTYHPTSHPTTNPTYYPTNIPTNNPTKNPTNNPTKDPTNDPTFVPTYNPTVMPTSMPFYTPTSDPTMIPTTIPSYPTNIPTVNPTQSANEGGVGGSTEVTLDTTQDAFVEDSTFGDQGYPKEVYIVMLIIILLLLICMLLLCCIYCKKRKRHKEKQRIGMVGNSKCVQLANVMSISQDMDTMMPATPMSTNTVGTTVGTNASTYKNSNIAINSEPGVYSDYIQLQMWLKNIDCMEYYDIFIKQGFGDQMGILSTLNDNDLQGMGVTKLAHRKRILGQVGMNNANMMNGSMIVDGSIGIMYQTNDIANEQGHSDSDQELYSKSGNNDIVNNVTTMGGYTPQSQCTRQCNVVNNEDINEEHTEGSDDFEDELYANNETEQ